MHAVVYKQTSLKWSLGIWTQASIGFLWSEMVLGEAELLCCT